jgi:hypothetical protein
MTTTPDPILTTLIAAPWCGEKYADGTALDSRP